VNNANCNYNKNPSAMRKIFQDLKVHHTFWKCLMEYLITRNCNDIIESQYLRTSPINRQQELCYLQNEGRGVFSVTTTYPDARKNIFFSDINILNKTLI
jgi:hypothetical protein